MKKYCTQNDGDCSTCSLVNYGRDCLNNVIKREEKTMTDKLTVAKIEVIEDRKYLKLYFTEEPNSVENCDELGLEWPIAGETITTGYCRFFEIVEGSDFNPMLKGLIAEGFKIAK